MNILLIIWCHAKCSDHIHPLTPLNSSRIRLHLPKSSCLPPVLNLIAYQLQFSCLYTPGYRAQRTYQESQFWRKLILFPLEAKAVQSTSVRSGASHCMLELWLLWLCASNHSCWAFMSGGQGPLPTGLSSQPKIILCKFFSASFPLHGSSQTSLLWTVLITLPYTHLLPWLPFFLVSDLREKKDTKLFSSASFPYHRIYVLGAWYIFMTKWLNG